MRYSLIAVATIIAAAPVTVLAHGEEGGMMGSGTMGEMMTLMHDRMDENAATDCGAITDEMMMEQGEEMMEAMMGTEDHERVEEAMEADMHDHDAMHIMMGMAGTGCVGDEVAASIGTRYGHATTTTTEPRTGSGGMLVIGLIGGAVLGFLGSSLKKPKGAPAPPAPPSA